MNSHVLIIAGMHRSGTSFTADWLQTCGLNIGQRLLYGTPGEKAHYEDKDFVELHKAILAEHQVGHLLPHPVNLTVSAHFQDHAQALAIEGRGHPNWGWKDPRTTLFLPFWRSVLPSARYLMVFRRYDEVVDSLHRRNEKVAPLRVPLIYVRDEYNYDIWSEVRRVLVRNYAGLRRRTPRIGDMVSFRLVKPLRKLRSSYANLSVTRLYARNWAFYNQAMLAFYRDHREDCLVVSIDQLLQLSLEIVEYLNRQWGFTLTPRPATSGFDSARMQRNQPTWKARLCERLYPPVKAVYQDLLTVESRSLARLGTGESDPSAM